MHGSQRSCCRLSQSQTKRGSESTWRGRLNLKRFPNLIGRLYFSPTEGGEVINKACVLQMTVRAGLRPCAAALNCTQSGLCRWIDWGLPTVDTPMGEGTYLSIPALRPAPKCSLAQNRSVLHACATRRRIRDKIKRQNKSCWLKVD